MIASGSPFGEGNLIAYKRLASYPVYVAVSRTRASLLREWLGTVAGYAAIGIPAAVGLILLGLLALRRTRREQIALARANEVLAERVARRGGALMARTRDFQTVLMPGDASMLGRYFSVRLTGTTGSTFTGALVRERRALPVAALAG